MPNRCSNALHRGLLIALLATGGCSKAQNVHDSPEAKSSPCVSCHLGAFAAAAAPKHDGVFPQTCELCHGTTQWVPSTFKHSWPLENAHATTACVGCHVGSPPQYRGIPTVCSGCHQKDYDAVKVPLHAGLPNDCSRCHTTAAWKPSTFLHPWPLDGAHVTTACAACHPGAPPRYANTPATCDACHHADYLKSTYPQHQTFATTCADCHRTLGWTPALPPGHPEAAFPLTTGKHATATITCLTCHRLDNGAATKGENTDCVHCHLGAHQRPAIDSVTGHAGNPAYPTGDAKVSFCLACHPTGRL